MTGPHARSDAPGHRWTLLESGLIVDSDGAPVANCTSTSVLATLAPSSRPSDTTDAVPCADDKPILPIVRWSGSYAEVDPDPDDAPPRTNEDAVNDFQASGAAGRANTKPNQHACFQPDPRTWMPAYGWKSLAQALNAQLARARSPNQLVLRTHARHVLSDTPSAFRFLRDPAFYEIGLLIDAVSMLTPAMTGHPSAAADHLTRIVEDVCSPACPRLPFAVMLGQVGAVPSPDSDSGGCFPQPFDSEGPIPIALLESLESRLVDHGLTVLRPAKHIAGA